MKAIKTFLFAQMIRSVIGRNSCDVNHSTCVRSCCPLHEYVVLNLSSPHSIPECRPRPPGNPEWVPTLYDGKFAPMENEIFSVALGFPECENNLGNGYFLFDLNATRYILLNGSLHIPMYSRTFEAPQYCIGEAIVSDESGDSTNEVVFLCFPTPPGDETNPHVRIMVSVCLIVSILFLAFTFVVYLLISEGRNLHGKTLLCHVGSMCVAYSCLLVSRLSRGRLNDYICITVGLFYTNSYHPIFRMHDCTCFSA